MKSFFRLLPLCAAIIATALPAGARPPVPISHPAPGHRLQFDPRKFMPVSALRPGMRGYALTVFKGTKIQRFGIEILGVIKKFNEGKDYILFRATSGPPVTEHLNIAHGMSGSPIYVDGKLVGAISMEISNGTPGPSFPRAPIALATPIEEMFDAWSPDLPSKPDSMSAGPPTTGAGAYSSLAFQPISIPVSVSGVTPDGIARLGAALAPYHFTLSAGGGGGGTIAKNLIQAAKPLQPGAAVGVSLMQGDMDFTATGTVTYRDGNRVLLFGHPFFDLGPVDAALTTASVVGIYPSYEDSVKLGQPLQTVGRIFQDRPFSVGGLIGSLPQMIPMAVTVNDLSIKRQKTFHVRIINHPLLTSQFVQMVAQQAIEQVHGLPGDSMATVTMDADVEEIGHVERTNTFYSAVNIDQAASADVINLMQLLQSNPFYPLSLKSLQMHVTIRNGHDTAEVDHIFVRQSQFQPGETIPVGVVLKPYKRAMVTRYVNVKIPENTPDGALTLSIEGGTEGQGGTISLGGLILVMSSTPTEPAATVAQLVKQFEDKPENDTLVARLTLPTSAVTINGEKLENLPPTLAGVIRSTHSTGIKTEQDRVKVVQAMPYVISGSQSLTITVKKKDDGAATTPSATVPAVAPTPPPPTLGSLPTLPETFTLASAPGVPSAPSGPPAAGTVTVTVMPAPQASTPPVSSPFPAPASPTAPPSPVPVIGRLPTIWRQGSMADFAAGKLSHVSVSSAGDVRLSATLQKVADTPETYIWAIQPDRQGNLFLATGDGGVIDKMTPGGHVTPFFKTGQLEVTSLASDAAGNLYAGTAPNGLVYRIAPDGKGTKFFTAHEKYVTALATSGSTLYAATGGGTGRVYALPTDAGVSPAPTWTFTSPEAHLLSLTTDQQGNVYAGSSPDGIIYKITPSGQHSVFFDASEPNIAALATDSHGNVYAGTTPKGDIEKITPDGTAKLLFSNTAGGVLSLRTDSTDNLYACAGNTIYRIAPDGTVQSFTANSDEQFLTLGLIGDQDNDDVYAGTGTVGSLYRLGTASGPLQGTFQSEVHDAGLPAQWGTLSWIADTPPGTHIALQTRSGDVPTPDSSWSAWSAPDTVAAGQPISSPPGRYLQYQALLSRDTGAAPDAAPRLRNVTAYYLTRNRPPTVNLVTPVGGAAIHKNTLLQWMAGDPDGDTLTYDLSYSADGGKTWMPIKKSAAPSGPGTIPQPNSAPAATAPVTEQEVQAKTAQAMANVDKRYPNLPPAVRQNLSTQTANAIRTALMAQRAVPPLSTPGAAGVGVKETSFSWDTTEVPDGLYQVRVVASDKPSNPVGALTAKSTSEPFLIANTPPTLTLGTVTVNADKTVTVHGVAQTKVAFVRAVQGHSDSGEVVAALADDGLFDSTLEPFTLTLGPLPPGPHTISVEALDQAENLTTATANVTIPGLVPAAPTMGNGEHVTQNVPMVPIPHRGKNEPPGPAFTGMSWVYDAAIRQWTQVPSALLPGTLPELPRGKASKGHVWIYDPQIHQWAEIRS